jgi:membrane protein involved in colicin uptake
MNGMLGPFTKKQKKEAEAEMKLQQQLEAERVTAEKKQEEAEEAMKLQQQLEAERVAAEKKQEEAEEAMNMAPGPEKRSKGKTPRRSALFSNLLRTTRASPSRKAVMR